MAVRTVLTQLTFVEPEDIMKRAALLLIVGTLGAVPLLATSNSGWDVVADGLNNPRGLDFAPDGDLYVAEAGSGGPGTCFPSPEGPPRCYGRTGAITRIDVRSGWVDRVWTGLPSLAAGGAQATGPHDVSFPNHGNGIFTIGFGGDPSTRTGVLRQFDQLSLLLPRGRTTTIEDLGNFEVLRNPTNDQVDSNPYGVLALQGKQIVADAGANALLEVRDNGVIKVLATFPDRKALAPPFLGLPPGTLIDMDEVPTSVALGPDGAYYVGQLTGFPFPVDGAIVYRVPEGGGTPLPYAIGFTNIIDITFGPDGSLYVLEIAKNGLLGAFGGAPDGWAGEIHRVLPNGNKRKVNSDGLNAPGGIVVNQNGTIYVTNNSIESGTGQVLRLRQPNR